MNKNNGDKTFVKVAGQVLQIIWQSSGAKIFLYFLIIACFFSIAFILVSDINPLTLSIPLIVLFWWVGKFLMGFAYTHPEFFQNSQTWLANQKLLSGDSKTGLGVLPDNTSFGQPILNGEKTKQLK